MSATNSHYDSVPLERPDKQIRLLTLDQGLDSDADISGSLAVHDLERCPRYTAISYTWGDAIPKLTIRINGLPMVVQYNCWYALWQMRYQRQYSTLWIDQICIDQQSVQEKNAQVAAMGLIYGQAVMVASCLGPGRSLEAMQRYDPQEDDGDPATKNALAALEILQHNPYFSRLWIKQEIILGKNVRLYCGTSWMEWDDLAKLASKSRAAKLRSKSAFQGYHPKTMKDLPVNHLRLVEGREQHWLHVTGSDDVGDEDDDSVQPWQSLCQVMQRFGDSHCQVRHDRFYAVLPLLSPTARMKLQLPVDYDSDLLSLARHMVRNVLDEMVNSTHEQLSRIATWDTILKLVRDWLHLDLDDDSVKEFLATRSSPNGPPILTEARIKGMERAIYSPLYLRCIITQRFTITNIPLPELIWNLFGEEVHGAAECSITDEMTADALHQYLCSRTTEEFEPDQDGDTDYSSYSGRFALTSLPPKLPVKMVQYSNLYATFVVPPETKAGDEILSLESTDPGGNIVGYLPVVRRYETHEQESGSPSPGLMHWVLIGWALQVDRTGRLNIRRREIGHAEDAGQVLDWENIVFHLHYEDLMMLAMLERDPAAVLTHGCMHDEHPSFLQEPVDRQIEVRLEAKLQFDESCEALQSVAVREPAARVELESAIKQGREIDWDWERKCRQAGSR